MGRSDVDCRDVQNLLHPYSDGELDLVRHLQIEHHLAECTECAEHERGLRQLRQAVASAPLYHRAPDGLRERILASVAPTPATTPARRERRPSVLFAALAAAVAAACLTGGLLWVRAGHVAADRLAEQVTASHVRSLQVAHLTDVPSSDRHTVKPWFQDKLNFSPQVPDLASDGFPLAGGRLDYLADRPVAAIVYHRRQHAINLFTWPAADATERSVQPQHRQGFHLRSWQDAGMTYWAVSDLNPQELDEFLRLYRDHAAPSP